MNKKFLIKLAVGGVILLELLLRGASSLEGGDSTGILDALMLSPFILKSFLAFLGIVFLITYISKRYTAPQESTANTLKWSGQAVLITFGIVALVGMTVFIAIGFLFG